MKFRNQNQTVGRDGIWVVFCDALLLSLEIVSIILIKMKKTGWRLNSVIQNTTKD